MRPEGLPPGPSYPAAVQGIGFWTRPFAYLRRCRERYGANRPSAPTASAGPNAADANRLAHVREGCRAATGRL